MSNKKKLIPTLRFPEFKEDGEWEEKKLGEVSQPILEKTKGKKYTLMSITSGVGLVTQIEKFGREIAGQSYKNYYVLRRGDFAYNKSSTKLYPEGEIAVLENIENGAVPNSIFTCFRFQETQVLYKFAKYPFVNNLHGRWLKNYITVGARANGALQVNNKDFFSIPFLFPPLPEQQKIADCLSSLDDLLAAHNEKLELLKGHKKGLMQNLFPQEGERAPKFRFPEFENDGEWEEKKLGEVFEIGSGRDYKHLKPGDIPVYGSGGYMLSVNDCLYDGESVCIGRKGTIDKPMFLSGKFWTVDTLFYTHSFKGSSPKFIFYIFQKIIWINHNEAGGIPSLSKKIISRITVMLPRVAEQKKIASCLSAVDDLIKAETEKIEALKAHKKGLMQGLFPKMEN